MWPLSSRVELENSNTNSLKTSPCPAQTKKAAEEAVGRPASGRCPGYWAGCRASLTQWAMCNHCSVLSSRALCLRFLPNQTTNTCYIPGYLLIQKPVLYYTEVVQVPSLTTIWKVPTNTDFSGLTLHLPPIITSCQLT